MILWRVGGIVASKGLIGIVSHTNFSHADFTFARLEWIIQEMSEIFTARMRECGEIALCHYQCTDLEATQSGLAENRGDL